MRNRGKSSLQERLHLHCSLDHCRWPFVILCLQGSPDGPEQYVAVNAIFFAQRFMVPIDSCYVGAHNSAFLQQASYITGGVYVKPQHMDGLFQYLATCILATSYSFQDLLVLISVHRVFAIRLQLTWATIAIFCKHHKKCSTCGSVFGQSQSGNSSVSDHKREAPET